MEEALKLAGLGSSQIKAYLTLLQFEKISPAEFAKKIDETRSNTYKILDELVAKNLARKEIIAKKFKYSAESPALLSRLVRENKDKLVQAEKDLENSLPELLKTYYKTHERPGVTFYQGKEGIEEIYKLQILEKKYITFLQTREDKNFFGFDFMHKIRNLAPKAKIHRKVFVADAPEGPVDLVKNKKEMLLERIHYLPNDYTAPVEWSVFGNKVSVISFGKEAIGTVIDSPQIAESFRQIFKMLEEGLKRRPGYDKLPTRGEFVDVESFIKKYGNRAPKI